MATLQEKCALRILAKKENADRILSRMDQRYVLTYAVTHYINTDIYNDEYLGYCDNCDLYFKDESMIGNACDECCITFCRTCFDMGICDITRIPDNAKCIYCDGLVHHRYVCKPCIGKGRDKICGSFGCYARISGSYGVLL